MKVLVVDDEVKLADALGELFRRNKVIADVVYDGEDGYFYAKKGRLRRRNIGRNDAQDGRLRGGAPLA